MEFEICAVHVSGSVTVLGNVEQETQEQAEALGETLFVQYAHDEDYAIVARAPQQAFFGDDEEEPVAEEASPSLRDMLRSRLSWLFR